MINYSKCGLKQSYSFKIIFGPYCKHAKLFDEFKDKKKNVSYTLKNIITTFTKSGWNFKGTV